MSKGNKIFIGIAIVLIIICVVIMINNKKEDTVTPNSTSNEVTITNPISTKKSNGTYEIYNTDIKSNGGMTKMTATIKNVSGNIVEEKIIEISLKDSSGNEIGTMKVTVPTLESGKTTKISAESWKEYNNIYDFEIK